MSGLTNARIQWYLDVDWSWGPQIPTSGIVNLSGPSWCLRRSDSLRQPSEGLTHNCAAIAVASEEAQAMRRGSSLEAFPLGLPLAMDQSLN